MTKTDFVADLAKRMDCSLAEAERNLNHCVNALKDLLMKGDEVTLPGFGKFMVRQTAARTGRNPQTGGALEIEAKNVPIFKPGDALKLHVNNALKSDR